MRSNPTSEHSHTLCYLIYCFPCLGYLFSALSECRDKIAFLHTILQCANMR